MELTLHHSPPNAVRQIAPDMVRIGDRDYRSSLLVNADRIDHPWKVGQVDQLDRAQAAQLLKWQPEVVIVGSGARITFPPAEFSATLMGAGVGLETMTNDAASRTFNVLLDEGRAVLLGLIFSPDEAATP